MQSRSVFQPEASYKEQYCLKDQGIAVGLIQPHLWFTIKENDTHKNSGATTLPLFNQNTPQLKIRYIPRDNHPISNSTMKTTSCTCKQSKFVHNNTLRFQTIQNEIAPYMERITWAPPPCDHMTYHCEDLPIGSKIQHLQYHLSVSGDFITLFRREVFVDA